MFSVEEISLGIGTRHPIKSDFVPKKEQQKKQKMELWEKIWEQKFCVLRLCCHLVNFFFQN
jgi:hypothetical protein